MKLRLWFFKGMKFPGLQGSVKHDGFFYGIYKKLRSAYDKLKHTRRKD